MQDTITIILSEPQTQKGMLTIKYVNIRNYLYNDASIRFLRVLVFKIITQASYGMRNNKKVK
jgi:hypothetical protein